MAARRLVPFMDINGCGSHVGALSSPLRQQFEVSGLGLLLSGHLPSARMYSACPQDMAKNRGESLVWVAVKELKLSYYNGYI